MSKNKIKRSKKIVNKSKYNPKTARTFILWVLYYTIQFAPMGKKSFYFFI